jgi:hypothetical protein
MIDRYIYLAFEASGFIDPEFEYSVSYCQGDHCSLRRASVALDNEKLLNELWPIRRKYGSALELAKNRRMHEVCRRLVKDFGVATKVVPVMSESVEVDLDLMQVVSNHDARDSGDFPLLLKLAGVPESELDSWAEELSDHITQGVKDFASNLGEKIYSVLHSAQLNVNSESEVIKEHCIGDYSVVIKSVVDEQGMFDMSGEMEDDMVISHVMMLARDQLQATSLNCMITHHPTGTQSNQTFWSLLVPFGDTTYSGFLWEVFDEAKEEIRGLLSEDSGISADRSCAA